MQEVPIDKIQGASMSESEELESSITISEAAALIRISRRSTLSAVQRGRIKARQSITGLWLLDRSSVIEYKFGRKPSGRWKPGSKFSTSSRRY